ncbi:MAG: helix-turn-helix domain-containing protein [Solirubrobacteraceae bacterium]
MSTTGSRSWVVRSPSDLSRAIAGIRTVRGMRQEDLATETGIDRTYLAKLEAGASSIQLDRMLRALRRMGATITITLAENDGERGLSDSGSGWERSMSPT